jgi:peptidoglycan hydrolase FlgJ
MTSPLDFTPLGSAALARAKLNASLPTGQSGGAAKAMTAGQDFEAVFLNSMFGQMFTGIDGDGPFGGGGGAGVWRSFLAEQFAKSFAKAGGIGIAHQVYDTLLAQQESKTAATPAITRSMP